MKKILLILFLIGVGLCKIYAQSIIITNTSSEAIISKATANVTSIPTGEPFNYQITFQNLNQANLLSITDVLPAGLCYSPSDIVADNSFLDFNGNPIPNPNTISGLIDTSSLPTLLFTIPNNVQRGSFTITVRFCAGVTPDGFTVENNICANYGPGDSSDESFCSTTGLTSTASAVNPWGTISKEPLFPAIAGQNGDFFIPTSNGIANYKIRVSKSPGFESSIFGMLNLQSPTISEVFPPCATITLISGPGTLDAITNTISLNNDLQGNVPFESAEFIVSVDFNTCATFVDGDVITNTVSLNGTPVGESMINDIDNATATVIAVDVLPPPVGTSSLIKSVSISNPVEGCLGVYTLQLFNSDNRPISSIDIIDLLPNGIILQSLSISGTLNSASQTDTFNLIVNSGTPTSVSLGAGYNQNPWAASNNDFRLISTTNTLLYPQDILFITIPFLLDTPIPVGTTVSNCATLDAAIIDVPNSINLALNNTSCADFIVETEQIKLCVDKGVRKANTNNVFVDTLTNIVPTDEVEFQICIQNNGSLDFTNGQLEDVLDAKYEFLSIVSDNFPSGTTFSQTGQTLTWSSINLSQHCATFNDIAGCINPNNQVFCVTIRVRVLPLTPPGNIDNAATLIGNGISETSELAKVNITQASVLRIVNEVSRDQTAWGSTVTLDPVCETDVYHRVTMTNLGNQTLLSHQIIDELPFAGDTYFPSTLSRNSTFSLESILNTNAPNYTIEYISTVPSTTTPAASFDCTTAPSGSTNPSTTTKSIVFNSIGSLAPGASSVIEFDSTVPGPTALINGDLARNSMFLVDCTGSNGGIIIPSNITDINIVTAGVGTLPIGFQPHYAAVPSFITLAQQTILAADPLLYTDKELGDHDNDGDIDFYYMDGAVPQIHYFENTAGMGNPPIYSASPSSFNIVNAKSFRLYDWDDDGWQDWVVLGKNISNGNFGVFVHLNNGNGTFNIIPDHEIISANNFPFNFTSFIEVGDLNQDGAPDILLIVDLNGSNGTYYFENNGANTCFLVAQQNWDGTTLTNPFIPDTDSSSLQYPVLYDADFDGDEDIIMSDPIYDGTFSSGGRFYFHENMVSSTTTNVLPNFDTIGVDNPFGLDDLPNNTDYACDWIVTRIEDILGNGCPIAVSYNWCNNKLYIKEQVCDPCSSVLSVTSQTFENVIVLFPNPSNNEIFIAGPNLGAFSYQIISVNGSTLFENSGNMGEAIDVSGLASGFYFINIKTEGDHSIVKRFIKQ